LEVVRLNAALGSRPFREEALEHAPRDPDHAVVLADLDPELDGLLLGVPVASSGK
jgi:hypothetical protein